MRCHFETIPNTESINFITTLKNLDLLTRKKTKFPTKSHPFYMSIYKKRLKIHNITNDIYKTKEISQHPQYIPTNLKPFTVDNDCQTTKKSQRSRFRD